MINRDYGIEIEVSNIGTSAMVAALRKAGMQIYDCNADVVILESGEIIHSAYDYRNARPEIFRGAWKVCVDGSVRDGCEVVSPILNGEEGLASTKKVLDVIKSIGGYAGTDCGLHVHVNARDLSGHEMLHAAKRYKDFEGKIDSFVDERRRGPTPRWCHGMNEVWDMLTNQMPTTPIQNRVNKIGRYHKLNLQAFLRHGTIEFRQLQGTLDYDLISAWVQFCVGFIEASKFETSDMDAQISSWEKNIPSIFKDIMENSPGWLTRSEVAWHANVNRENAFEVLEVKYPGNVERHPRYPNEYVRIVMGAGKFNYQFPVTTWSDGISPEVVQKLESLAS